MDDCSKSWQSKHVPTLMSRLNSLHQRMVTSKLGVATTAASKPLDGWNALPEHHLGISKAAGVGLLSVLIGQWPKDATNQSQLRTDWLEQSRCSGNLMLAL